MTDHQIFLCVFACLIAWSQFFLQVRFRIVFLAVIFPFLCLAQKADTILLPTAEVAEKYLRESQIGNRSENWNRESLEKSTDGNLADLLQNESGIFMKSYGNGSIATVAARGGSAGHTAVLWNGLPLQSPMLGLLDFSLIPLGMIEEATAQFGGNSAAWGSGAIGGVVSLKNKNQPNSFAELQTTIGSYGLFDQRLKTQLNFGNWKSVTRLFHREAKNDFTWQIREDLPTKTQTNAALNQKGLLQEFYWSRKSNEQLAIRFWGQNTYREIPPDSGQRKSLVNQKDEAIRVAIDWKKTSKQIVWNLKTGAFRESIHFKDPIWATDALSHFWSFLGEAEGEWFSTEKLRFNFGASLNQTTAQIANYDGTRGQFQTAIFGGFRRNTENWQTQFSLRQNLADGKLISILPSLGVERKVTNYFSINGKVSRNYRLPTLNDLHWNPGGNPNLLPESGWSQELTFKLFSPRKEVKKSGNYSITFFNRQIKNWILWSPDPTANYWSAQNLAKVHSRGIEQRIGGQLLFKKLKINLSGGYDFILSTNEEAIKSWQIKPGDQLWYVPKNQVFGKFGIEFKSFELNYRHQFTGEISTVRIPMMEKYQVGNLNSSFAPKFGQWSGRLFFSINNVWNTNYRVIEYRPMPGRNFQTGFKIKFSKNNKS